MNFGLSDYTIATLRGIFKKYPDIEKVIIYGSRAKGNYRAGSDIDITLLTSENFTHDQLLSLMSDFDDSDMPYFVDVSVYNTLSSQSLKDHINRVGKALYER